MNDLNELTEYLDTMLSEQKEKKNRTFVARYNGKNIVTRSGKSSWKAVNHAKAAILLHFSSLEDAYAYGYKCGEKIYRSHDFDWNKYSYREQEERRNEFRTKLWELIEIVELE